MEATDETAANAAPDAPGDAPESETPAALEDITREKWEREQRRQQAKIDKLAEAAAARAEKQAAAAKAKADKEAAAMQAKAEKEANAALVKAEKEAAAKRAKAEKAEKAKVAKAAKDEAAKQARAEKAAAAKQAKAEKEAAAKEARRAREAAARQAKAEKEAAAKAAKAEKAAAARQAKARKAARAAEKKAADAKKAAPDPAAAGDAPAADPRWRRRKDARPDELVAAALALFAEQGFAKTNLRDVAKAAGVSKGTVYLYFKNKEDLLRAAVQKTTAPILDFGDDLELESEAPASELLRTLVTGWVDEFERRAVSGLPKLVVAEAANFPEVAELFVDSILMRARRLFQRVLKRGVRAGEFRADLEVRQATHVLLGPIIWSQIHQHSLAPYDPGFEDPRAALELHLEFFVRAIKK